VAESQNITAFGLPDHIIRLIYDYFTHQPDVIKVVVYGSRAMGSHRASSDIDLAILSTSVSDISGRIKEGLENLPTPYLFDVVDYTHLQHAGLKCHIERVGVTLYSHH
jgi:uncharacterized protein